MSKEESLYSKKDLKKLTIELVITNVISIVLSVFFCFNSALPLAGIGISKYQIQIADEARLNNDFSESVKWYKKLANKNNKYSPYAYISIAEIYSFEMDSKHYEEAFQNYKLAVSSSNDIRILNICMYFIIQQMNMFYENPDGEAINMLDSNNIEFVVDVMNKINTVSSETFYSLNIDFPLSKNDVSDIFDIENTLDKTICKWKYVSTLTTTESNLGFENDDEKLLFVETWQELTGASTTRIIYKYYRYKHVHEVQTLPSIEAIESVLPKKEKIYLSKIDVKTDDPS